MVRPEAGFTPAHSRVDSAAAVPRFLDAEEEVGYSHGHSNDAIGCDAGYCTSRQRAGRRGGKYVLLGKNKGVEYTRRSYTRGA